MSETCQWVQCFWSGETDMMGHNLSCPDIKCKCKILIILGDKGKILHNLVMNSCPHDIYMYHKEKQLLDSKGLWSLYSSHASPFDYSGLPCFMLGIFFSLASYLKSWNSPSCFLLNPALIFPTFHSNWRTPFHIVVFKSTSKNVV